MKLKVLNKVSYGYELGYVLNPVLSKDVVSAGIFKSNDKYEVGDTVIVKANAVIPYLENSKWGINFENVEIVEKHAGKPDNTRNILKEALQNNSLKMPDDCTVLDDLKLISKNNLTLPGLTLETEGLKETIFKRFIPIRKLDDKKQLIYGVVYEPFDGSNIDAHGDYATEEEIEKTAHLYLEKFREMSFMHEDRINELACPVESFIAPSDYKVGDETIKKGSWVMVTKVHDKELWKQVEDGEIDAYSIEGVGMEGPNLMKSIKKSEGDSVVITKKNLVNMTIDAVALVDKGANKKRFYLRKRETNKEQLMNKELALLLVKSLKDKNLIDQIIKALPEEDKKEVEEAAKPEEKPVEEKKAELDPAMVDQLVAAVMDKLKAMESTEKVEDEPKEEEMTEDKIEEEVKKYLNDENLDIPDNMVQHVIKRMKA